MPALHDSTNGFDVELVVEIAGFLAGREHGASLVEVQVALRRRRSLVLAALASPAFQVAEEPVRGSHVRKVYSLAPRAAEARGTLGNGSSEKRTHCDLVLARLKRGPATHRELYALDVIVHSRISDLRPRVRALGLEIPRAQRRTNLDGTVDYVYRLVEATLVEVEERTAA